jgi:hypothetical protein
MVRRRAGMSRISLLLFVSGLLFNAALAAAAIAPVPLPVKESTPEWDGAQFVQSDRAGNVFFLRANTFEVYPVTKRGDFADAVRLHPMDERTGYIHSAVLSADGDQWLLYADFSVRLFVDGKEKPLPPLKWNPWGVGFLRDTPFVAVIPRPLDSIRHLPATMEVPWLLELDQDGWSPVTAAQAMDVAGMLKSGKMNDSISERAVFLKDDKDGKLWVAHQYGYRLQRFSPSGRQLLEITVDGGTVQHKQESKEESAGVEVKLHGDRENPTEATRDGRTEKATYFPFTGQHTLLGMTQGLNGCLYLLVRTQGEGVALDRYDPTRVALERLPLQLEIGDAVTMAAGRDALYLAAGDGRKGRWRIAWDVLDLAHWQKIANARIDDVGLEEKADAGQDRPSGSKP